MTSDGEDQLTGMDDDDLDPDWEDRMVERSLRWLEEEHWGGEAERDLSGDGDPQGSGVATALAEAEAEAEQVLAGVPPPPPPPDPAMPSESEINTEQRRMNAREIALLRKNEAEAAELAVEWYGTTGELFDPSTPELVPCVLEYGIDQETGEVLHVFPEGVSFLFGTRSALKTWLVYFAQLQELRKGNWVLVIDYELSYEEAMRRFHTLADGTGEPLTPDQLGRLVYINPSGPPSEAGKAQLVKRFADAPPSVVGIDSVGVGLGLSGLDENVSRDVIVWGQALVLWLKKQWPRTAIILIDHVPHPKKGVEAKDPIGSQRKAALADSLFFITAISAISRKTRGSGRLTLRKSRKGHGDENVPLLDFEFGGGGPLVVGPADLSKVPVDLTGVELNAGLRIAEHVGEHEPAKVVETRKALHIGSDEFTFWADQLARMEVIVHPPRGGLSRGPRWQEYIDNDGELDVDLD